MTRTISNYDDVIDSRDVIARIEELEGERDSYATAQAGEGEPEVMDWEADFPDDAEELATLKALAEEAEGYAPDWTHGETLIRDSYFVEYAQELAEDIGAINHEASWPNTCIDWEQAARELRMDYTAVEFGDVTYWIR
jgi:antirestriction protein